MFRKISATIQLPQWAQQDDRYMRLDLRDRLLDGTFYDHLKYAFYDETEPGTDKEIPIADRRPSAQFRLPRMVSRWCARKLFAGRHRPKLRHPDKDKLAPVMGLLRRGHFMQAMTKAVLWGSVGAVAVTFRVELDSGQEPRLALQLWRAKYCKPSFDEMGELSQLRVNYTSRGSYFRALGATDQEVDDPAGEYWYIRDYLPDRDVTYKPVKRDDWDPVNGFHDSARVKELVPWDKLKNEHALGFVPGHWFVNLAGGDDPDGACTWSDAIPNSIELDYTLSQVGRGVRYNCAPQLVVIGRILNATVTRGPMSYLHVAAGYKDEDGATVEGGDAKLLEMSGTGTTAALNLIDHLRNYALEQIAASRKDPDKMKAPLSGRAMEYLDEDTGDLVMDLRNQYGEDGALPLIKKICIAAELMKAPEAGKLALQWPRMFQPTPDEVKALIEGFAMALDPMKRAQPATPGKPAGATGAPATPAQPAQAPGPEEQLLTVAEARAYLLLNLDMAMLDTEADSDADTAVEDSPTPPQEPTPPVPPPSSIDIAPGAATDNVPTPGSAEGNAAPMTVGAPVRVNA